MPGASAACWSGGLDCLLYTSLDTLGITLPFDETVTAGPDSPLAQPIAYGARAIGNRFSVLPMEGWDGTHDGRPTELTARRWQHFGASGAKLIWGGEAVAVRHDGRANPRQLMINADTWPELAGPVSYTHLDVYKRQADDCSHGIRRYA